MKTYPILTALICLLALVSCREEVIKPSPPAGSFVFGGKTNEVGTSILELSDGDFLLLGGAQDEKEFDYDITFTKIDAAGGELWTKPIREPDDESYGLDMLKTADGFVVLALRSDNSTYNNSSIVLHWFDEDLNETRKQVLGNPAGQYGGAETAAGLLPMDNGGFLIPTNSYGAIYLLRVNADGSTEEPLVLNNVNYNFPTNYIAKKPNGGFVLVTQEGYGTSRELVMFHLDAEGSLASTTTVLVSTVGSPEIKGVYTADDGSYLVSFSEYESNPSLIQVDSVGNLLQEISLGSQGNYNYIWPMANGSYLLAGGNSSYAYYGDGSSDAYVGVLDSTWAFDVSSSFGGDESEKIRGAAYGSNGNLYLLGQTQSYGAGGTDMYLIITQP